jgi:hypothetical protein
MLSQNAHEALAFLIRPKPCIPTARPGHGVRWGGAETSTARLAASAEGPFCDDDVTSSEKLSPRARHAYVLEQRARLAGGRQRFTALGTAEQAQHLRQAVAVDIG